MMLLDDGRTYGSACSLLSPVRLILFHLRLGDSRDCFSHARGYRLLVVALFRLLLLLRRRKRRRCCFRRDHRLLLSVSDET